ncbi:MAG: BON domain-containing protein [Wenzhouxiangellaceae bacterium]|nr:BON domain-containing protein [Wenzhouxiangellaceae bacterium]
MSDIATKIRAGLERDPAINLHEDEIEVVENDEIRLEGSVSGIKAKRRALVAARQAAGTPRVMDCLKLRPEEQKNDDQLADALDQALRSDPNFRDITIAVTTDRGQDPEPGERKEWISISASDGILELKGIVHSLSHRRLAEVMAWWVPGVADVANLMHVEPAEEENDAEIKEALELVFDKDPALDHEALNILVRDGKVTLGGGVPSEEQKQRTERNCWYLPGVHDVDNQLEINPAQR